MRLSENLKPIVQRSRELTHIVQSVENNVERLKVLDVEARLLDVAMDGINLNVRVEMLSRFLCNECLGALDVLFAEQKLSVEV